MRVGLVGCGSIGVIHAKIISNIPTAELCSFADIRIDQAQKFAKEYTRGRASVYSSLEEMLEDEELEIIHICTPHAEHVPMAISCLKNNINVFVEKPPAIHRTEFQLLQKAVANSKGKIGFCFQNRYNESTKKINELLNSGRFGEIKGARAFVTWSRDDSYYTESDWRGTRNTEGGGVLINQAIHTLDLLLSWMGTPITVEASMQNHHLKGVIEVEDTLEAYLTFHESNTVRAVFYATNAYVSNEPILIELRCEHGMLRLEGNHVWYQEGNSEVPILWREETKTTQGSAKSYWGSGHKSCIQDFYTCLQLGVAFKNDLKSVENTFETMINIYDSAKRFADQ